MQPTPFSRRFELGRASLGAVELSFEADADERAAIASEFDLLALDSFVADFEIAAARRDIFELRGRIRAKLAQRCVVSLAPVPQTLEETFVLDLAPAGSPAADAPEGEDRDPPAVYEGESIDLGAIALEYFSLGLDPYPRAPGVELPAGSGGEESAGPFAQLARLRTEDSGPS